ncbi:hypothetical protein QCD60_18865 [Pokkaliibacter sp. MBI-7]|uniref:hypothetical protein n=1 Tax=Pokkaliibacter sp. MBI-7 TaxID=3040600 RepID=UPI002448CDD9|nr:hypothetical protein [Pokkaliibacter sp. MBI-7]MDH2434609.1 hypothetical protein [Pokkaliibacter sp. MBI-7]
MDNSVQREKFAAVGSAILLGLAILILPNQFLFSKTMPNSFWTEYFPRPFGAGWFITFVVLCPVCWLNKSVVGAVKSSILGVVLSIFIAVPIALIIIGGKLSSNNLLSQYVWVGITCYPPLILQAVLRWLFCIYTKKWLKRP